jgi:uncharacterized protein (TIGR02996 family)
VARFEKGTGVFEITSADPRYATEQRKHLREGWRRVADPRCEVPLGAEPINPVLEEALRADPKDISVPLVYADWLQQQGHPRGALITVQHRLASNPRDEQLVEAERKIIEDARDSLVSKPMLAHLALLRGKHELAISRNFYEGGTVTFDHGFIREALVVLKQRGADEDLFWELLRHPSARVLGKLGVTVDRSRDIPLVATMITHGPCPPLRSLSFRVEHRGLTVDLTGLDAAYPQLEELELAIHNVRFGELELPRLRRLGIVGEHSDIGRLLAAQPWPSLETLSLSADPDRFPDAFASRTLPKLRTLELGPTQQGLELCRMIVRSPHVGQLETLALVEVRLTHEAVTMLVENRERFASLVMLRFGKPSFVLGDGITRLIEAGYPVVVQR